ncbi:ras-related and estrogen-regulated growth inhibitor-like protein isoform X1 [Sinocyclocheilus anshuiensis]|uniref:small monomeric GTPase n=1 Tax=Sinocyclocheilus anshuiensis TaxID=1608454 RepID=A0A671R0W5_9TELE|nr:PREDICTED: ras-related and estrogen-regulated growth inhibitor-like protein isoform X1 [Sinocyclocheilus anshuiensis]
MNDIKVAVMGSEGVGKSALIVRFLTRRFIGEYASSSECIYRKRMSIDGRQLNLELYDPCSQPCQGKSTLNEQIHWADGFVVVYDISDRSSFLTAKAIVHLIRELHLGGSKSRDTDSVIFLVGNKQDLCHMREVDREEGQKLASEGRCQFYELSAAEHYQEVVLMFSMIVRNASLGGKAKERRRRPSGSKSMAKLINNVFGKRRKSV